MKYTSQPDGEWFHHKSGSKLACCSCGLVHRIQVKVVGGKVYLKAIRDARASAAKRRYMKGS